VVTRKIVSRRLQGEGILGKKARKKKEKKKILRGKKTGVSGRGEGRLHS